MGLIRNGYKAAREVLTNQYLGVYAADQMGTDVLALRAGKRVRTRRGGIKTEMSDTITNGSVIIVGEGQCMLVTSQGKVAELCSEPGEFVYDKDGEPSIFYGEMNEQKATEILDRILERMTFGNVAPREQKVYFINTKEISGNKYGTPNPIPFRLTDKSTGRGVGVSLRCFGEYSYRIAEPLVFFENVCGGTDGEYTRDMLEGQLRCELLTALQAEFAKLSAAGVGYDELPLHTAEISKAIVETLSESWSAKRGIRMLSFGISSVSVSNEDMALIRELQKSALPASSGQN